MVEAPAEVMHQRCVFQPLAFGIGESMDGARLVEQRQRQSNDLLRMLRVVVAALGELERAAATDVRNAVDLRNLTTIPTDVIEYQPLTESEIAQRQFLGAETPDDRVEQHGAGDDQGGASRVKAGDRDPLL